jgi:hypothetical protein
MRSKIVWFGVVCLNVAQLGIAQSFQVHYDLAREHVTTTLEYFQTDKSGAWFTFVDFDFNRPPAQGSNGVSAAYWEIARYLSLPVQGAWSATVQYNDGLDKDCLFNPVWLAGVQHLFKIGPIELPVDFLLRRELNTGRWTGQLTLVWSEGAGRWAFSGYLDIWNTGKAGYPARRLAFMAEPQIWFFLTEKIALGGELEISFNFNGAWSRKHAFTADRLFLLPTLAIKWDF